MQNVKNILFDLGGVILNIDLQQTVLAFAEYGIGNFNEYYTLQSITPLFEQLETGAIAPQSFYSGFRTLVQSNIKDEEIKTAWNALLLDFPMKRINWLKKIKNHYNIYLLSNTNEIHYNAFIKKFSEEFKTDFNELFSNAYYSHKIGLRKPDKKAFEFVLNKEKLNAGETIFIDDSELNIEAAKQLGLQTVHLFSPNTILNLGL